MSNGIIRKAVECQRKTSITASYRYEIVLECGHRTTRPCRWNRAEYVPPPPTKLKCRECGAAVKGGAA